MGYGVSSNSRRGSIAAKLNVRNVKNNDNFEETQFNNSGNSSQLIGQISDSEKPENNNNKNNPYQLTWDDSVFTEEHAKMGQNIGKNEAANKQICTAFTVTNPGLARKFEDVQQNKDANQNREALTEDMLDVKKDGRRSSIISIPANFIAKMVASPNNGNNEQVDKDLPVNQNQIDDIEIYKDSDFIDTALE